jgi:1,4-dihydroxy-2-naphthoate octaprenyltransferase
VTHATNEIYDWRSGTDRVNGGRALSGGSRVRNLDLLDERDLWWIFAVSTVAVAALTAWVILARAPWLALLILGGYALGLAYTIPPIATSYRPLAGEWLGGFPGVLLSGLGAYGIQTLSLSVVVVLALSAHALVCTAMLMVHHYLDAPMDAAARPPKRTTVVAFGFARSKLYAGGMASIAAGMYGILGVIVHPAFLLGAALTAPAVWIHLRIDPTDLKSVTRGELRIIQLGIAAGLSTAVGLAPPLWPLLPIAAVGYLVHLAVVSPPAELGRAWRKGPLVER